MERQFQLAAKKRMTVEVEVGEEIEEIVGIGDLDHMIDQVHMIDQRVEREQIVEIEVGIEVIEMIGVVGTKVEIRVQETRETIQVQDIPQVCIVTIVK